MRGSLLLFGLLALPCGTHAQPLAATLQDIATQRGLMGMSVVATCGDSVIASVHLGKSDLARDIDVTDATRYRIASISKLVTAIGLMRLHEQGAFGLDDDVSPALGFTLRNPSHPGVPITYRMLLSHRAGVQDGSGYGPFLTATYAGTPPPPIQQLMVPGGSWYTANMWRSEQPGSYFVYSNVAWGLIGTLIEAHSGQRFDQYMRQEILLPMGILGSYNVQDLADLDALAVLYRNSTPQADDFGGLMPPAPDLSTYAIGSNGLYFAPQGGLRCSALELAQVLKLLHGQGTVDGTALLTPATTASMTADAWTWNGSNGDNYFGLFRSWGMGVHRITAQPGGDMVLPGTFMWGHAGEAYGLISDLYLDPASGFGLVFLTNGYTPGNNYTPGQVSAFYRVEEEVFNALGTEALPACVSTGSVLHPRTDGVLVRGDHIQWTGATSLELHVFDTTGRLLARTTLAPGATWWPPHAGPLLLVGADGAGVRLHARLF